MYLEELFSTHAFGKDLISLVRQHHQETSGLLKADQPVYPALDVARKLLQDRMEGAGWAFVGKGYYSMVFEKPGDPYVLKVNVQQDTAFAYYAYLSRKFSSNPHFPKITNARRIQIGQNRFYLYAIEKLKIVRPGAHALSVFCSSWDYDGALSHLPEEFKEIYGSQLESLFAAALLISKNNRGFTFDLHSENLMRRNDGTIVIIDPYSN